MKMEELHRRRASIMVQSPNGSFAGDPEFVKSPQPSNKTNHSRQNSLRVAVQHRRASIISTTQQDLLEVGNGQARSRSGSFRSHSNENLLLVSCTLQISIFNLMHCPHLDLKGGRKQKSRELFVLQFSLSPYIASHFSFSHILFSPFLCPSSSFEYLYPYFLIPSSLYLSISNPVASYNLVSFSLFSCLHLSLSLIITISSYFLIYLSPFLHIFLITNLLIFN